MRPALLFLALIGFVSPAPASEETWELDIQYPDDQGELLSMSADLETLLIELMPIPKEDFERFNKRFGPIPAGPSEDKPNN